MSLGRGARQKRLSRAEFDTLLAGGDVTQVLIRQNRETPTGEAQLIYGNAEKKEGRERYYVSDVNALQRELRAKKIDFVLDNIPESNAWLAYLLPALLAVCGTAAIIYFMQGRGAGANTRMMNFGKSRARMTKENKENFTSVAGLEEEKEDLQQIVDFLRAPKK